MARTTRITIETESVLFVRQGRTVVAWCPECQAEVEVMLLGDQQSAAQLTCGLGGAALHVWTPAEGDTQICLPSLLACGRSNEVTKIPNPERRLPDPGR
jgi:hypothetical protein